jgi:hypothetical protein
MWKRVLAGVVIAVVAFVVADATILRAADSPLQGAWQIVDQNGRPGPGLYIFAKSHYSMMTAGQDRPDIVDISQATADDLRALYGPMAANAGAYEVSGDLVTIRPVVAKIPVVMKPGAYEVYAFAIEGNTLTLTQRRNVRGPVEGRQPVRLTRVE